MISANAISSHREDLLTVYIKMLETRTFEVGLEKMKEFLTDGIIKAMIISRFEAREFIQYLYLINSISPFAISDLSIFEEINRVVEMIDSDYRVRLDEFGGWWTAELKRTLYIKPTFLLPLKDIILYIIQYQKLLTIESSLKYPFDIEGENEEMTPIFEFWNAWIRKISIGDIIKTIAEEE